MTLSVFHAIFKAGIWKRGKKKLHLVILGILNSPNIMKYLFYNHLLANFKCFLVPPVNKKFLDVILEIYELLRWIHAINNQAME